MDSATPPRRPSLHRLARGALALALATGGLAACSDDGRTLAPPRPDQTIPTTVAPSIGDPTADGTFSLAIPDVEGGGELPERFTCFGEDLSPPMAWQAIPEGALTLAVVVRDRDAGGYVHWLITGIDPTARSFGEGGVPESAVEQVNSAGVIGWRPPCPPDGERHVYDVVLHVLRTTVDIDPALPAAEAAALVEAASTEEATLAVTVTAPATGAGSAP